MVRTGLDLVIGESSVATLLSVRVWESVCSYREQHFPVPLLEMNGNIISWGMSAFSLSTIILKMRHMFMINTLRLCL